MTEEGKKKYESTDVDWEEVLSSARNYVEFLRFRFGHELTDEEVETRAYQYVIDPAALKQLLTGHIRWFWKNYLQAEWTRVRPMLDESAKAADLLMRLTQSDEVTLSTAEVQAVAKAAGLNPRSELPHYLNLLAQRRLIDKSAVGDGLLCR